MMTRIKMMMRMMMCMMMIMMMLSLRSFAVSVSVIAAVVVVGVVAVCDCCCHVGGEYDADVCCFSSPPSFSHSLLGLFCINRTMLKLGIRST